MKLSGIISSFFLFVITYGCISSDQDNQSPLASDPKSQITIGERIHGPANIRDSINGKIIFELNDNVLVESSQLKNNWYQVGTFVSLKKDQSVDGILKKGTEIFDGNGNKIGIAKADIESWIISEQDGLSHGFIGGFTFKENIKPNSIAELELEKILSSKNHLELKNYNKYLEEFKFRKGGLKVKGFEDLKQFYIYGSWIDDPSPIDRIRLMFLNDSLVAIIHERELKMKNKKSFPLIRNLQILIIADLPDEKLTTFIENNKVSYNGVD